MQVPTAATMQGQAVHWGKEGNAGNAGNAEGNVTQGSVTGKEEADSMLSNQFSLWVPGA